MSVSEDPLFDPDLPDEDEEMPPPPAVTVRTMTVAPGQRPVRLDVYLTQAMENATRAKVQTGIAEARVLVNGRTAKPSYKVAPGDVLTVTLLRPPPGEAEPEDLHLTVVYEDTDLLIVDKAAGMVVHPAHGNRTGTMVNGLLHHIQQGASGDTPGALSTLNDGAIRPGIVHRLDKDTSGLLVVAKSDPVHAHLARQFARRTVEREYWALCWGVPAQADGVVETDLGRDPRDRKRMAVVPPGSGKHAITTFRVLESFDGRAALVALRLKTGRTHQIRVHLAHLGHPLLGDPTYGGRDAGWLNRDGASRRAFWLNLLEPLPGQALHARTLGFIHPGSGQPIRFEAPPPPAFGQALDRLRSLSERR